MDQTKTKRMSHHYTDELEIKSLLIRLKNSELLQKHKEGQEIKEVHESQLKQILDEKYTKRLNAFINNDIERFKKLKNNMKDLVNKSKSKNASERLKDIQGRLKDRVIKYSEVTLCDYHSKEKFGEIVILMVKNILRKPNFQMLEYHDEFYSDQSDKIFKYIQNFDHTKISERSGYHVNAFQYISQIIHNSIIHIINQRKREQEKVQNFALDGIIESNDLVDDEGVLNKLIDLCPLEFPFNIEDAYPFVIKDLLNFIQCFHTKDSEDSILDVILDYAETSKLGPTLVGDQIRQDEYLVKFVQRFNNPKYQIPSTDW